MILYLHLHVTIRFLFVHSYDAKKVEGNYFFFCTVSHGVECVVYIVNVLIGSISALLIEHLVSKRTHPLLALVTQFGERFIS